MADFEIWYDDFKEMWLRDDEDWVKQRKEEWRKVLGNMSAYYDGSVGSPEYKKQLTHYYVFGERLTFTKKIVKNNIYLTQRLLCIPWSTGEELVKIFHYRSSDHERSENILSAPVLWSYYFDGVPSGVQKSEIFCMTFFSGEYEPDPKVMTHIDVSPKADRFIKAYIQESQKLFEGKFGTLNATWLNFCFEYFLSCVSFIEKEQGDIQPYSIRKMYRYLKTMDEKNHNFSEYQREVFDNLYPFLMSDDAPKFLVDVRNEVFSQE